MSIPDAILAYLSHGGEATASKIATHLRELGHQLLYSRHVYPVMKELVSQGYVFDENECGGSQWALTEKGKEYASQKSS